MKVQQNQILTYLLPTKIEILPSHEADYPILDNQDIELSVMNLANLGCIMFERSAGGMDIFSIVRQTLLGKCFYEACTLGAHNL